MNLIAVNDAFHALVTDPNSQAAFCDERGHVLGYYMPAKQPTAEDYAWAKAQFTEEELDRASRQTGGRTWQEIKSDLERLP